MENIIPKNIDTGNGKPGMELWKILVLGTLPLNCNWDYDKIHDIANNHKKVREFLGHTFFEFDHRCGVQTIKDNVSLCTAEVLDEINQVVIKVGHDMVWENDDIPLKGRCDAFSAKTDFYFSTDTNLLLDAIRKVSCDESRNMGICGRKLVEKLFMAKNCRADVFNVPVDS